MAELGAHTENTAQNLHGQKNFEANILVIIR